MSTPILLTATMPQTTIGPMGSPKDKGEIMRRAILRELLRREALNMPSPTWEELGEAVGISAFTAKYHAKILRLAKLVTFADRSVRTIRTTPKAADAV